MKNFSVFEETSLPPREAFHNDLTGEDISPEKYEFTQRVWDTTGCQTLGDYHDLYLYHDIFLLADIFEQFRQVCLTNYQLDPVHYYTVPGLAWDASLKKLKSGCLPCMTSIGNSSIFGAWHARRHLHDYSPLRSS